MAILKCKMCGGNIEVIEGQNIGTCDSCGSTMTLPNNNDERILNLFDRANHYRLQNEFDKALATYENILAEDNNNAEAHWGCVLSRYGIEYVEDPKTHKRVPTCHRVQNTSILSDLDYKSAVEMSSDSSVQDIYKSEAQVISEIQKNILSIANNEEAYDIFICYKETDNNGKRTVDSTIAQDIYYQLTDEGYKVFFSRITLEDKLGAEYEPYIFAALNSAKIMLVIGTNENYFNAVWVKNEWSRFLDMSKKDKSKIIIPCYRDMDAYNLPDELSMFQSQDMSKIGFIQDLLHGIKKVLKKQEIQTKNVITTNAQNVQVDPLLQRAFLFLEEAEWNKADNLLEEVLNHEPKNAMAYLGKLMIEVKVNKKENLGNRAIDFNNSANYNKALRFADDDLKTTIIGYYEKAKMQYDEMIKKEEQLKEEQKELDKKLEQEVYNLNKKYCELREISKASKIKNIFISLIFIGIFMLVGYKMMFTSDIGILVFMLSCIPIGTLIMSIFYSKYDTDIIKQKARMILIEEKYNKKTLDDKSKELLNKFIDDSNIKFKGQILNAYDMNKICKRFSINMNNNQKINFIHIINAYKPPKIKEDPEIRRKKTKKAFIKYGIISTIIILLLGSYFIISNAIQEKQRQERQEQEKREYEEAQVFVPNLIGKTVSEAEKILKDLGVNYEFSTNNPGVNGKNYASTEPDAIVQYQRCNGDTMYFNDEKYDKYNATGYIDKRYDKIELTAETEEMINHTGEYYIPSSNSKYTKSYYGY